MTLKKSFLLLLMVVSVLACRLSSEEQVIPDLINGGVPPPPVEDYGVLCFVEYEDFILADAPNYHTFSSQDGGLSWKTSPNIPLGFHRSGCNPSIILQKELWATPDGLVRYRFAVGQSIDVSYDQGMSWQLAYDLVNVSWEPMSPPDPESDRVIISKPGPLNVMIDPYSGNLLLAMGHAGILVRQLSGEWRWVSVGPYEAPDIVSPPGSMDEADVDKMYLLPLFEQLPAAIEINTETRYVDALVFSPDGTQLVTSGFDGGVKLFGFLEGELQHWLHWGKADRYDRLYGAIFSDDGETLITCGTNVDQMLRFWDVESLALINQYEGYQTSALDVGTFAGEQVFAVGKGQQVVVFRLPDGDQIASFESQLRESIVTRLQFIPERKLLAVGGTGGGLELWNFEQQEIVFTLQLDREDDGRILAYKRVVSLGYDPSEEVFLALDGDGKLTAWDVKTGAVERELALQVTHGWLINTAAFSDDGRLVAVGMHNSTLIVFDSRSGKTFTRQWITGGGTLQQLAFSPDGQWIAAGFANGEINIWSLSALIDNHQ